MNERFRVGFGFDFHPFAEGRCLFLGGIKLSHQVGLKGYSDADVLVHALADALLGAAGLKDIGTYFPDTDPANQDISSLVLLEKTCRMVQSNGFSISNVDITVLAEEPRIQPYVDSIKASLSRILSLRHDQIGLKATTMEGRGIIGRKEGIAVQSVALLTQVVERK